MNLKETVATELADARRNSLALLDPLTDGELTRQHSPLMSPLIWDLAHVGNYEDIWLVRSLGAKGLGAHLDSVYDAFANPRVTRKSIPFLSPSETRIYISDVRSRALELLDNISFDPGDSLLNQAFVYGMVVQHEHQHDETMLATLQLMEGAGYAAFVREEAAANAVSVEMRGEVLVEGGPFIMGASVEPWAYDNERPAHDVHVDAFWIDTTPVTNRAYIEFVDVGGYDDPRWWSSDGWKWRQEAALAHPQFWSQEQGSWTRKRFGREESLPPHEPVQHVCWYEADAYARWSGKRLPTEAEWEKAASWDPTTQRKLRYPWGDAEPTAERANLGVRRFGPAPVGTYPEGASPWGCQQMLGDVWEWTASDFRPYPGFTPFPYDEYSNVFYGPDYKVLRGGSWATQPAAMRSTFRNWDFPIRRQIFAGFRCARNADS